jgi:hypothetical protein
MEAPVGEIEMAVKFAPALLTLTVAVACKEPDCAVTVTTPKATAVAIPVPLTDATFESDELHCAELDKSLLVPSE